MLAQTFKGIASRQGPERAAVKRLDNYRCHRLREILYMSISIKLKVLAGAVALAIGGTAMANTALDEDAVGDLILNIVDTTNSTSFLYDTGVSQAAFNGSGSYTFNFASDPNYTSFLKAGDVLEYSVISTTKTTATPAVGTVFFTGTSVPVAAPGANIAQVQGAVSGFVGTATTGANSIASTTTNSVVLSAANYYWGDPLREGLVSTNLYSVTNAISAAPGTSLAFYSETSNALRSTSTVAAVATFAGTFSLNGGVLTYSSGTSTVPLPTPLLLLLSGLGLMGVVARRGKGGSSGFASGAAA